MHPAESRTFKTLPLLSPSTLLPGDPLNSSQSPTSSTSAGGGAPAALAPEEMAHVISELRSPGLSEERMRALLALVGVQLDDKSGESGGCKKERSEAGEEENNADLVSRSSACVMLRCRG
ncbi:hypothetical protein IAT38_004083 [Cryptococcus sp. DSM 104549]